jgi:beta propeller repeat protein
MSRRGIKSFTPFLMAAIALAVASCCPPTTPYVAEEFPICTNRAYQARPAISGDIVAWVDFRNGNNYIYGARLSFEG